MSHAAFSSSAYWEARYRNGGTSGAGSCGRLAAFKADFINAFVADNAVASVLDFGCGDGNLLSLLSLPDYVGVDVSATVLARCAVRFAATRGWRFLSPDHLDAAMRAELALSVDVVFHLVEDDVYERYLHNLFAHATRFVIVYSSNQDATWPARHVRHRRITGDVTARWPAWHLLAHVPNRFPYDPARAEETSFADFFVYTCTDEPAVIRVPGA